MVFVPMAKARPKAVAEELSYDSLNLIHEFTSLFRRRWFMMIYGGWPRKAFSRKQAFVDINAFPWLHKQQPIFAQGQPKGNFQLKELHRTTKAFSEMNADWNWRRHSMLRSMCQHVARLQSDSCAEKCSLCGTVMIHDGLNLRCFDQCHGARSHGRSSYQTWRKRLVIRQSEFDP